MKRKKMVYTKLDQFLKKIQEKSKTYMGYPNNLLLDNKCLSDFLDYSINNIGDPFTGNNGLNSLEFECDVLEYHRSLLFIGKKEYWGYVTSGGTEGNLFALLSARYRYPEGKVYYSEDSHYSIPKSVDILKMNSSVIKSHRNGEMDYTHLEQEICCNRSLPPIIVANIGTTMKGAVDKVRTIVKILQFAKIDTYYIHCDAALMGGILPYITERSIMDFRLPIDSVSISGHKFLGSPIPCGVVLARREAVKETNHRIEYIDSLDNTISGSRNGLSVLIMWKTIELMGKEGLRLWAIHCICLRDYAMDELKKIKWPAWHNDLSNTIVIKKPENSLVRKWHLATQGDIAHIIIMPNITKKQIDLLVLDLKKLKEEGGLYEE